MSLIYGTSVVIFALKIFLLQHSLLLLSLSDKFCYDHSGDNVDKMFFVKHLV